VEVLARHGAHVLVVDRDRDAGRAVAARTGQSFVAADVGVPADWQLVRAAADDLGNVRYVHLNAGVNSGPQWSPLAELADDRLFGTLAVNLAGVVLGVRALAPLMEHRAGSVLVTASLAALGPFPADPVYAATKAGVIGFVRSVAGQLDRQGIRINVLCPTATDTPMVGEADREWLSRSGVPLADVTTMAEAMVACLTGPGTGQVFRCDGDAGPQLVPVPQMGD